MGECENSADFWIFPWILECSLVNETKILEFVKLRALLSLDRGSSWTAVAQKLMMKSSRMSRQWWKGFAFLWHKTSNFFLASLHLLCFTVIIPSRFKHFLFALLCVLCVVVGRMSWRSRENSCEVVAVECRFVLIACAWAIYSRPQDTITTRQHTNNEDEDEVFFSKNILSYLRCGFHCLGDDESETMVRMERPQQCEYFGNFHGWVEIYINCTNYFHS